MVGPFEYFFGTVAPVFFVVVVVAVVFVPVFVVVFFLTAALGPAAGAAAAAETGAAAARAPRFGFVVVCGCCCADVAPVPADVWSAALAAALRGRSR
jgi:hypothetical protein